MLGNQSLRFILSSILVVAILGFWGCRPTSSEPEELETVDVGPGLEVEITNDLKAAVKKPELVGILPNDFPSDMPLYLPSSLVDFGRDDGGRYISLLTPHDLARIRRALPALLRDSGWQMSGDLARPDGVTLRKGQRQVRLRVADGHPGTVCRYSY